jgi:hypothetical protein
MKIRIELRLTGLDPLTKQVNALGIDTWDDLIKHVKSLPYGRNKNRQDLSLVLHEKKGSCSSKHALLKQVADFNGVPNIKLMIGLYKMNQENTPRIGSALIKNAIDYIPEAHCYLLVNNERTDITTNSSEFQKIENDIITEKEIQPHQVSEYKVEFHQKHLRNWIIESGVHFTFDEIWAIREQCIENLTEKPAHNN